ncbi:MAG: 3-hydroxyacyl-ACP dehydratase FabZ family protein [Chthoniobacterales bacterium]
MTNDSWPASGESSRAYFPNDLGLPHRPPFVFVKELRKVEPGQSAECTALFSPDDPMFAGHFPGNPLVPGVILTEALAQTAGIAAASGFPEEARPLFLLSAIRAMKFFAAARPAEEILLRAEKLAQVGELWQFQVSAKAGEKTVAEGQLVLNLTTKSSAEGLE